jgi:hypothetical protein
MLPVYMDKITFIPIAIEEQQLHQMPADHFAFLLCSFPERVYNFVGCSDQSAASIVNSFEDSLFDTLLQSLDECVQHQSSGLSIELFARILSDYNSISEEVSLWSCEPKMRMQKLLPVHGSLSCCHIGEATRRTSFFAATNIHF